jgi:hypothetical protein
MTLDERTLALQRLVRLHEEMSTVISDFPRKTEVLDYLRWAIIHISEKLWLQAIHDEA